MLHIRTHVGIIGTLSVWAGTHLSIVDSYVSMIAGMQTKSTVLSNKALKTMLAYWQSFIYKEFMRACSQLLTICLQVSGAAHKKNLLS